MGSLSHCAICRSLSRMGVWERAAGEDASVGERRMAMACSDARALRKHMNAFGGRGIFMFEEWFVGIVEFGFGGGFVRMLDDARGGIRREDCDALC